jgi:hypothetical protein
MATIADIRKQFPQYADISDEQLAQGFHTKYYSDIPYDTFKTQIGLVPTTPVTTTEQMVGLGSPIARFAKGAIANPLLAINQAGGAVLGGAGQLIEQATGPNAVTGFLQDVGRGSSNVVNQYDKATQEARKRVGSEGFDFVELGGSVASPVNRFLPGGTKSQAAVGGAAGAALTPVTGENLSTYDVLSGKVEQLGIGAVAGRLIGNLSDALTPTLKPGVRELMDRGIPVTPGQAYSGPSGFLFRQIEKLDIPLMRVNKEAINLGFTKATGDDVLGIVGDKLPANMKNGQQIFGYIQDRLTKFYDTALDKIGPVRPDLEFTQGIAQTVNNLNESLGAKNPATKEVKNFIQANVLQRVGKDGSFSAKDVKRLDEIFRTKIDSITANDTPAELRKAAYDDVYKTIKGLLLRNDEEGNIAKANLAYMQRSRILEATNKNVAEIGANGTYSPAELAKVAAKQGSPIEAARGTAPLQAEATRALNIVGDTTQEAAKFRSIMIAGKLTGLGALGLFSPTIALPILTASGLTYGAAKQLMKDPGATRTAVAEALQKNPSLFGIVPSNIREQIKETK